MRSFPRFLVSLLFVLGLLATGMANANGSRCERQRLKTAQSVPVAAPGEVTVATQNLWRLFDDVDNGGEVATPEKYRLKLGKLAHQLVDVLQVPDVVAVQEAENQAVLRALAAEVARQSGRRPYQAILVEGQDPGGIDVGFLVRPDWKVQSVTPLLAGLRMDGKPLFDRPPLHLVVLDDKGGKLELINVHLKSLRGSDKPAKALKIAEKRRQQAAALAGWWRQYQQVHPRAQVLMLGDFNATPEVLGNVDVLGKLQAAGLSMLGQRLPEAERYSYVFQCRPDLIDNILASPALVPRVNSVRASRGNADAHRSMVKVTDSAVGSSDHDALLVYLRR